MTAISEKKPTGRRGWAADLCITVAMLVVLAVYVIPCLHIAAVSFSSSRAILNDRVSLWPVDFTLDAYRQIFAYPTFLSAYQNTIIHTFCGTLISLVMTILFAYPLSKAFLRGQKTVMRLVVFTMFFSGGLMPNYLLVASLGLTGTRLGILIPFAISPFYLIILISFFRTIPVELEEAARIDGYGWFGILLHIVLPLSGAAIATIGLYTAVFFWNDWFYSLIYLKDTQYPAMLVLRNIVSGSSMAGQAGGVGANASLAIAVKSAVIIITTIPPVLIYPFLQKHFVKGMTIGAVKG